jgi:hypothetical protein
VFDGEVFVKKMGMALAMTLLLTGCGSNFEWFPDGGSFGNSSSSGSAGSTVGKVMKRIHYPSGVTRVSDLAYDRNNGGFWLLYGTNAKPSAIQKMSATFGNASSVSGQLTGGKLLSVNWPDTIVEGSSMAFDGTSFWITSNDSVGGVPVSKIYKISSSGAWLADYACPATSTGFCQGLVWDPNTFSFWTAGSDNTSLVNFQVPGSPTVYPNLWSTNGVSDVAFDSASGQTLAVKNGVILVKGGTVVGKRNFTLPGSGKGDWDGSLLWIIDNDNKVIKGVSLK